MPADRPLAARTTHWASKRGSVRVDTAGLCLLVILALQVSFYGADRTEVALLAAFAQMLLLSALLACSPRAREELGRRHNLCIPVGLFVALVGWTLFQFAPTPNGMARDAWAQVAATPAITIDKSATAFELIQLVGLGAVFIQAMLLRRRIQSERRLLALFCWAAAIYTAAALAHFMIDPPIPSRGSPRLAATLLNANNTSALLGLFAIAAMVMALTALKASGGKTAQGWTWAQVKPLVLPGVLLGLALWAGALTGSRGGAITNLLGLLVAGSLVLFGAGRGRKAIASRLGWTVAGVLVVAIVILMLAGDMSERLRLASFGVADRQANIQIYLGHLAQVPWTGFGLGTFHRFNSVIVGSDGATKLWQFGAMHNVVLQWIYEAGLPGAALMFACIGYVVMSIARDLFGRTQMGVWPVIALSASVALVSHGMIDFDLQIPAIAAMWAFLLGLAFGEPDPTRLSSPVGKDGRPLRQPGLR